MPPKASADGAPTGKMFSADVVAALIMSFSATSITKQQYELMSSMDGVKTPSAFQHDFRSVLAKAKELKSRIDNGEVFAPVQTPARKVAKKRDALGMDDDASTPPATPTKKPKGTPKGTPKPKATPKPRGKKAKEISTSEEDSGSAQGNVLGVKLETNGDYAHDNLGWE